MIPYLNFNYIYPPRPEFKIPPSELYKFETGEYAVQPKYNGTCCIVFTNGEDAYVYNRHKQELSNCSKDIDFKGLALSDNWYVFTGATGKRRRAGVGRDWSAGRRCPGGAGGGGAWLGRGGRTVSENARMRVRERRPRAGPGRRRSFTPRPLRPHPHPHTHPLR